MYKIVSHSSHYQLGKHDLDRYLQLQLLNLFIYLSLFIHLFFIYSFIIYLFIYLKYINKPIIFSGLYPLSCYFCYNINNAIQ